MSARPLSPGEVAVARSIFGHAINYAWVQVHKGKYIVFQRRDTAMAPNGNIYFPDLVYKDDFSRMLGDASWLIHELTHVWQYQQGMWVRLRGALSRRYHYGSLHRARVLTSYGIEQQAAIVADYFNLTHGMSAVHGSGSIEEYRATIPFLPQPER